MGAARSGRDVSFPICFGRVTPHGCGRDHRVSSGIVGELISIKKTKHNLEKLMKQSFLILLALGAILAVSACNTVHGAGQDVKSAGQGIENASDKH